MNFFTPRTDAAQQPAPSNPITWKRVYDLQGLFFTIFDEHGRAVAWIRVVSEWVDEKHITLSQDLLRDIIQEEDYWVKGALMEAVVKEAASLQAREDALLDEKRKARLHHLLRRHNLPTES